MCWTCKNQQYCGSLYEVGYAPVYECTMKCRNKTTGEEKTICTLGGWGIFSAKAATKAECDANMSGLTVPSGDYEYGVGTCDSSGSHSCSY